MGKYPVDAVEMLAKIAGTVEPHRTQYHMQDTLEISDNGNEMGLTDLIALNVETTVDHVSPAAVIVPTRSGATARSISRFKLPVWITAVSSVEATCQRLQFSYGVYAEHQPEHPGNWKAFAQQVLDAQGVTGNLVILTEGPSAKHPDANNRIELIDLSK